MATEAPTMGGYSGDTIPNYLLLNHQGSYNYPSDIILITRSSRQERKKIFIGCWSPEL